MNFSSSSQAGVDSTTPAVFIAEVPGLNIWLNLLEGTDPASLRLAIFLKTATSVLFLAPVFFLFFSVRYEGSQFASRWIGLSAPGLWVHSDQHLAKPLHALVKQPQLETGRHLSPTTLCTPPAKYCRAAQDFQMPS